MDVLLMMSMAAATATPPSGFSCCNAGIADRGPDTTAKDRWDGLVRRANASALLPPLAHFACPLLPSCRDIVGAALVPQVRSAGAGMGRCAGTISWGTQCTSLLLSQVAGWDLGTLFLF